MNYSLILNGEVVRQGMTDPLPESYDGRIVPERHDEPPIVQWPDIVVPADPAIVSDNGVETVVYGWVVRPRTQDERRREWSAKDFDERVEMLAPGAWDRLADAAANPGLPSEVRAQLRKAIRQSEKAVSVVSDNPDTLRFIGAAVAVGVLTQEQATAILEGP